MVSNNPFDPSGSEPFDENDPFMGIPMFGDLFRMFRQQGSMSWDSARQLAISIATDGKIESNVDPIERIRIEQLARVAELQVANATGLSTAGSGGAVKLIPVTRSQWVDETLVAYRPLFEELAQSIELTDSSPGSSSSGTDLEMGMESGDVFAWMAPLMKMLGPMMLAMIAGSMVGRLAKRSFGQYDLPIPRPAGDQLLIVAENISDFGNEWSLDADDLALWLCLHEVTYHAVLSVPHVRSTLESMLHSYLSGFEPAGAGLEERLTAIDSLDPNDPNAMFDLERMFGDPELLLGAIRSERQRALLPQFEALTCAMIGYVDYMMDQVGHGLISSYDMVTEALRRRRVEADPSDRFVERLFGLELTQQQYDRGTQFISGVVERAGKDGINRLWESQQTLPTPAEVDAPGLWLARIDLPDDI